MNLTMRSLNVIIVYTLSLMAAAPAVANQDAKELEKAHREEIENFYIPGLQDDQVTGKRFFGPINGQEKKQFLCSRIAPSIETELRKIVLGPMPEAKNQFFPEHVYEDEILQTLIETLKKAPKPNLQSSENVNSCLNAQGKVDLAAAFQTCMGEVRTIDQDFAQRCEASYKYISPGKMQEEFTFKSFDQSGFQAAIKKAALTSYRLATKTCVPQAQECLRQCNEKTGCGESEKLKIASFAQAFLYLPEYLIAKSFKYREEMGSTGTYFDKVNGQTRKLNGLDAAAAKAKGTPKESEIATERDKKQQEFNERYRDEYIEQIMAIRFDVPNAYIRRQSQLIPNSAVVSLLGSREKEYPHMMGTAALMEEMTEIQKTFDQRYSAKKMSADDLIAEVAYLQELRTRAVIANPLRFGPAFENRIQYGLSGPDNPFGLLSEEYIGKVAGKIDTPEMLMEYLEKSIQLQLGPTDVTIQSKIYQRATVVLADESNLEKAKRIVRALGAFGGFEKLAPELHQAAALQAGYATATTGEVDIGAIPQSKLSNGDLRELAKFATELYKQQPRTLANFQLAYRRYKAVEAKFIYRGVVQMSSSAFIVDSIKGNTKDYSLGTKVVTTGHGLLMIGETLLASAINPALLAVISLDLVGDVAVYYVGNKGIKYSADQVEVLDTELRRRTQVVALLNANPDWKMADAIKRHGPAIEDLAYFEKSLMGSTAKEMAAAQASNMSNFFAITSGNALAEFARVAVISKPKYFLGGHRLAHDIKAGLALARAEGKAGGALFMATLEHAAKGGWGVSAIRAAGKIPGASRRMALQVFKTLFHL